MKRRALLLAAGASAALATARLRAQPTRKPYRIGSLFHYALPGPSPFTTLLSEHGWVEGRDFVMERRISGGDLSLLDGLASELVSSGVDLIFAVDPATARAAQRASRTIPIVVFASGQPVDSGLVQSLARPGGNITGNTGTAGHEVWGKYVELMRELLPRMRRMALLCDWGNSPTAIESVNEMRRAGRVFQVSIDYIEVRTLRNTLDGLERVRKTRSEAVFVTSGPIHNNAAAARDIAAFALRNRLPTITDFNSDLMSAGFLMTYAPDLNLLLRSAVSYVDRIMRGAKPADLPIQQPTKFNLIINRRTAAALGIRIPQALLLQAHEVLE